MENKNGKTNGKTNGNGHSEAEKVAEESRKTPDLKAEATTGKTVKETAKKPAEGKKVKAGKEKVVPFEAKPVPEAVKGIAALIEKIADIDHLKAIIRVVQKHWKKTYLEACKKVTESMKAGNVVWFRKGSKLVEGKVVKVKSNGKVKIDGEDGKKWKVPGMLVHKGKPTGTDRAEATGSEVTKKAA
jgi:hypothetical protein